jgi:TetR/AcrR family transcriptional regulator
MFLKTRGRVRYRRQAGVATMRAIERIDAGRIDHPAAAQLQRVTRIATAAMLTRWSIFVKLARARRRAQRGAARGGDDMDKMQAPLAPGKERRAVTRPTPRSSSSGTRASIMAAAVAEFAEKGYDGARVDEIAMHAGVNKNLLYHHFGSKDGLFTAVLEYTYDAIRKRQKDLELRDMDPVTGMRKLVIFTGRIWVQLPHFQRLLHSENLHEGVHVRQSANIPRMYNPLLDTIRDLLDRGVKTGQFRRNIDPIDLYVSISALTAHYISNRYTFEAIFGRRMMTPKRIRQRLEHAAEMILRYVEVAPR